MCELDYYWILICSKSLKCPTLHWVRHGRSHITATTMYATIPERSFTERAARGSKLAPPTRSNPSRTGAAKKIIQGLWHGL